jgi:hypothetical protein
MKNSELNNVIQSLIANSVPFVILNALGTKKEKIDYVDKKTGQKASFSYFAHKCTTTAEQADFAIIRDSIPKGEDAEKATRPSYKGKQLLVIVGGMVKDMKTGINTYDGKELHVVEPDDTEIA